MYDSINEVIYSRISNKSYDVADIEELKILSRLFDPSRFLTRPCKKPPYIDWLPDIPEEDFDTFLDAPSLMKRFIEREEGYITLAESGAQRVGNKEHPEHRNIIHFQVLSYLQQRDKKLSDNSASKWQQPVQKNRYAYELPLAGQPGRASKGFEQLLDVSSNNFRGIHEFLQAFIRNDKSALVNLEAIHLLDILTASGSDQTFDAFRWQQAYTDTGRRRYKPASEGFTFKIKKASLQQILGNDEYDLWYHILIRLAHDDYRAESNLHWRKLNQHYKVEWPND